MKFSELKTGDYFEYENYIYMKIFTKNSITYNCVIARGQGSGMSRNIGKDVEVRPICKVMKEA